MTHYLLIINYTDREPHTYSAEYQDGPLEALIDIAAHHVADFTKRGRNVINARIQAEPEGTVVWPA